MSAFMVPLVIRGNVIEDGDLEFGDRGSGRVFSTPDVTKHLGELVNRRPETLGDLYDVSLEDIYGYLDELGKKLNLDRNPYWREAFEVSCHASNLSREVLEYCYRTAPSMLHRANVRDTVEARIGSDYLEGWVPRILSGGRVVNVRAVGSRSAHIIAGNVPVVALVTVMRAAVTRNDAIIKAPSNDPLTASAIARTAIEMAPDHPVTKHLSVAYWKGGDERVESQIYHPANIEKIVAWGGYSSIRHISKYLGPGLDLITLDPKSSTTLIGREALKDEATMLEVAARVAADLGGWDQEACVNARVMFLESGTDPAGIAEANRFGRMIWEALQTLPRTTSSGPVHFDPQLKSEILGILPLKDFYNVITDIQRMDRTGAVIVSQSDDVVDFPKLLYGRVGNLVPLDRIEDALSYFTAATQTVGIYPDHLRRQLRDRAALVGGQIFQPVGYAIAGSTAGPQDGIEPERRMCRWVVDNDCDPTNTPAPWLEPEILLDVVS